MTIYKILQRFTAVLVAGVFVFSSLQANVRTQAERDQASQNYAAGLQAYQHKDYTMALQYFREGCSKNYGACFYLWVMLMHGQGTTRNIRTAMDLWNRELSSADTDHTDYLLKVAQTGIADAYFILAFNILDKSDSGADKALEYCQRAVDMGSSSGYVCLGMIYRDGAGVPRSYQKALEYYQKAANMGDAMGNNSLAEMYEKGVGVQQDKEMAMQYYQRACNTGYPDACNKQP
ncbi:tetratricopeptide repeat protein [Helicobacter ailurogastricus]|uniref:tetratricopeptide repeat protein n=1 Tax=Helicobacter ailurogastricus TaxID=1578720 RepID=UPI000CF0F6F7|nr:tetratricopeptide repeat protein [Helicobacter ailurogastricus]